MPPSPQSIHSYFSLMRSLAFVGVILTLTSLFSTTAYLQAKAPYTKERLLQIVRLNALSTRELVQYIEGRGVSFQMTPQVETEFQAAGARPEVIAAARDNYRPPAQPAQPTYTGNNRPVANPPSGPPLTRNEIVTALQNGAPAARIEQTVTARGVDFKLDSTIQREIVSAGGTPSLIRAINANFAPRGNSGRPPIGRATQPQPPPSAPRPRTPDYDELTDQAVSAMSANDTYRATQLLQQAIELDSAQPKAYQLLGFTELYGSNDILAAERSMRAAIEHGGSAVFHVYHDHNGSFASYCEGSLFVSRTGVSFKANDGRDTFETEDENIKEIKTNGFVGAELGAFHIKPKTKINGRDNFNFAPATRQKAEAQLIINLVKSYQ